MRKTLEIQIDHTRRVADLEARVKAAKRVAGRLTQKEDGSADESAYPALIAKLDDYRDVCEHLSAIECDLERFGNDAELPPLDERSENRIAYAKGKIDQLASTREGLKPRREELAGFLSERFGPSFEFA